MMFGRNAFFAARTSWPAPRSASSAARTSGLFRPAIVRTSANGGSAGDAQHLAGEFLSRLNYDRAPLAAVALTTDSSVLTAIGNDYGYERVFERQIMGLGRAGDVFVAISTSGRSPNIVCAIDAARRTGLTIVGFTGRTGGEMASGCDLCLHAPVDATPLIQQIHITAGHIACGLVEERLFPRAGLQRDFRNAAE